VEKNPKLNQAFGHVLRKLREDKDASQQEVADYCRMERAYVSRLERALLQPSLNTIFRISEYFGISPSELMSLVQSAYKKRK
jgi:transcriptional regulator with XRE-family HTH domain